MLSFALAAAIGLLSTVPGARAFDCNVTRFDDVSTRVVIYGSSNAEVTTVKGLKDRCDMFDRDISYLQDYTKNCVSGLANGMVKLLLEGASNDMATRCTVISGDNEFFKLVPCLNRHGNEILKCNRNLAAAFESANTKAKKSRVPLSCCYMGSFVDCVARSARKCGPDHERFARGIIDNYAADLLSTVCVKWKAGSKACKDLPKIVPASSPKHKSIIAPLADVLLSLNN